MLFKDLEEKIGYLSTSDRKLARRAFDFAKKYHEGQLRKTGEPFVTHELETAIFIANLKLDAQAIAAALLHDVCEDTVCNLPELKKEFGLTIANIVDGVTKLGKISITRKWLFVTDEKELKDFDRYIETLRKMFIAMAKDIRVIMIKLADRLHNMKTLAGVEPEKRYRIAKETLEIYAPLAYRLGMGELKGQLEDLAFPYVYPQEYADLRKLIKGSIEQKQKYLENVKKTLFRKLAKVNIRPIEIHGRVKHIYSLWRKLMRFDNDLNNIYDLVALRVIVKNLDDCYKVLGVIHEMWKPLVGRIKDYIAQPKPNGYQSLHTTVFADNGKIIEIQIRTQEMHDRAENGIAAHWHYSENKNNLVDQFMKHNGKVPYKELVWVKELNNWQGKLKDNKEIAESLALDFFTDRIFVYTPQGDVKDLPVGATPIDFAYTIHSDVGNSTVGAKVNGRLVNIEYHLQNGDIIEIVTKKNSMPKRDWLEFAKTSNAKSKIKAALGDPLDRMPKHE